MLLQLAERANHQRVLEVVGDGRLKQRHLLAAELRHALVKQPTDARISRLFLILNTRKEDRDDLARLCATYQDLLDVSLAISEAFNDFLKVLLEQLLVSEKLLFLNQLRVLVVVDIFGQNRHRVVVLLAKEEHVETRLLVVDRVEGEGALSEHRF